MKTRNIPDASLGRFLADLARDPTAVPPPNAEQASADFVRLVVSVERSVLTAHAPDASVRERVWHRVMQQAGTRPQGRRFPARWISTGQMRLISLALILVLVVSAGGLWLSPAVRAGTGRLACLVPALGLRSCDGVVLTEEGQVVITRDGATFTVLGLFSSAGETSARIAITGLPAPPPDHLVGSVRVLLHDEAGKTYPPQHGIGQGFGMDNRTTLAATPPTFSYEVNAQFAALDASVRMLDVELTGPAPIGLWHVRVPLRADKAAKQPAAPATRGVSLHGITVQVVGTANSDQGFAIQLSSLADPAVGNVVWAPSGMYAPRTLILRDDQGREYTGKKDTVGAAATDAARARTEAVIFPPVPNDAQHATLLVPYVTVEEPTGIAALHVPLAGVSPGTRIPLIAAVTVGQDTFQVTGVTLVNYRGERRLIVAMAFGDWQNGRKVVGVNAAVAGGRQYPVCTRWSGQDDQCSEATLVLPAGPLDDATITFSNPQVAVQGPWQLDVPLPHDTAP